MLSKIYIIGLVSIFLISGLATIVNETTNSVFLENDNFDSEKIDQNDDSAEIVNEKAPTRAIDLDLSNIYWAQIYNNVDNRGTEMISLRCTDLNRDGLMDLVSSSRSTGYVFANIQNPGGSWSPMYTGLHGDEDPDAVNVYVYLDVGDINNDGWPDIVAVNFSSMWGGNYFDPVIYLNNNGNSWTAYYDLGFETVLQCHTILLEDFNNDNILDLAYADGNHGWLFIYEQNPIGTWTKIANITSLSNGIYGIDTFNYDNDGDMDLVIGCGGGRIYIVTNDDGTGVNWSPELIQPPSAGSHIMSVDCGDVNHDGRADIVFTVYKSAQRHLLILSNTSTAWVENIGNLPYFGEYVDTSVADINFDGYPDIIASGGGGIDVFLGDGNFNWTPKTQGLSSYSNTNCIVDIDNDGVLDIFDAGGYQWGVATHQDGIYETKGLEKMFIKSYSKITNNLPFGQKFYLDYGDVDNDGLLDIMAVRHSGVSSNNVLIYYNNGDDTWTFYSAPGGTITNTRDGVLGDIDQDGDLDVVFCTYNSIANQDVHVVRNAGDGTFPDSNEKIYSETGTRTYKVDVGDFDYDADLDIISMCDPAGSSRAKAIWLIENASGTWTKSTVDTAASGHINDIKFADVNGDYYLDIIACGYSGYGARAFIYNASTTVYDEVYIGTTSVSWSNKNTINSGDINNDGITEVIYEMKIYSWNASTTSFDLLKSFGEFSQNTIFNDLNFDGLQDIIQIHPSTTNGFTIWTNKGNNVWQKGVYQNPDNDYFEEFVAFDYDWDGTKELLFSSADIGIKVYEINIEQDKTEIEFSNPQPLGDEWQSSVSISPSITISDIQGSGVDGNMIEYSYKTHVSGYSAWNPYPSVPQDAQELEVTVTNILFAEGTENFIKWRAKDVVGNGYTESDPYQILIDVTNPYYQNENPPNDRWVNSQSQTLSVQVNDDWSGLDAPSIKYKLDTGNGYGEWVSAGETNDGNTLVPSTIAYLSEGVNKIIWAAEDKVGHSVKSPVYVIKLDTQPTTFKSPVPEEGEWMTNSSFKCSVNIFDSGINGSGVNSSAIQYRYSTAGIFEYGVWTDATDLYQIEDGQNIGVHVNTTTLLFLEGTNNYVQYQALDKATNGYTPSPDYQILIDTTNVTFTNPLPTPDNWQSSNEVVCYITIEDIDGSGVDGTSAEYFVVKNDPDPENATSNWTKAVTQISAQSVTFDAIIEFPDGAHNYVKWRAKDVASNGFTESGWNQIKVDSSGISFTNPVPTPGIWKKTTSVWVEIDVTIDTDPNHLDYSNPQSLQYRYTTNGVTNYGIWTPVNSYKIIDSDALRCSAFLTLVDGTENYVQWRAIENVSESHTISPSYQIKVDTIPLTFTDPLPGSEDWQSSNEVTCHITIEDIGGSGVDGTTIYYWVVKDNFDPDSEAPNWTKAVSQINGESVTFSADVEFPDGVFNYIRWCAKDVARNGYTYSNWYQVKVDSTDIYFANPIPDPDVWQTKTNVQASIFVTIDTDPNHLDYSNKQSLQYRYSVNGLLGFGMWTDVSDYWIIDSTTLVCNASLFLVDGTNNFIQWRAIENVSDDYTESLPYPIQVDTMQVIFSNPLPDTEDWQASNEVDCYITIEDIGGSGVDGASAEYWVVKNNPNPDSESPNWTKAVSQASGESLTFPATVNLPDGIYNYIKWRAKDVAGNGFTLSNWQQVKVDSTGIQFSSPSPTSEEWQTSIFVDPTIVVTIDTNPNNLDYSNPQSLQYRYSTTGILGFGSWRVVDDYTIIDNTTLQCEANLMLAEGTNNYVQWRALENVSKGSHTKSSPYQIKIDSTPLTFTNPVPTSNTVNEYLEVTCYITLQDTGSTVDGSRVKYRYSTNGNSDSQFTAWNSTVSQPNSQSLTISVNLEFVHGVNNYLQWSGKDIAGNGPIYSQKYQIKVNFIDSDDDGFSDDKDYDDDNDGVLDTQDDFPLDPYEWQDTDEDGTGDNEDTDDDDDGVLDDDDAFPTNPAEHSDWDHDGIGDNSDSDDDNDGVPDLQDEFPNNATEWDDTDGDDWGDNSDPDIDGDGHDNEDDAFPTDPDEWADTDSDGTGDNADSDIDGDGWSNTVEDAAGSDPYDSDDLPLDTDGDGLGDHTDSDDDNDGVPDLQDKFPVDPTEWADTDGDGTGDNTDSDIDDDGRLNADDAFPSNPNEWDDTDGDNVGDNSDTDIDGDGYINSNDDFPYDPEEWQDTDNDGLGDNTDPDNDNDGVDDDEDAFPSNPAEYSDFDNDSIGDNADSDDDNDGVPDIQDDFPYDPEEWLDADDDGLGNNEDPDDDNDGFNDDEDKLPYNPNEWEDLDGDGIGDNTDSDIDGDGFVNTNDIFPSNSTEWYDTDSDGIGNNEDEDDDDDGYNDTVDDFPTNPNEWIDTDGDGIGDNSDSDIDNDGWSNTVEEAAGSDPYDKNNMPLDTDGDGIADNADLDDDNDGRPDYDDYAPLDKEVQADPNLVRIAGVEFEIGELIIGILMAIGAVILGTFAFTRKKRLYNKHKHRIEKSKTVKDLNAANQDIKADMERERLTPIQLTMLKEIYDDKYMELREKELERKLGKLPSKVEDSIRGVISDKIITQEEFVGMQRWLSRLKDSKDFDTEKKVKLQGVLRDWIDENVVEDWDVKPRTKRRK